MVNDAGKLAALERIARLKAERELRKFAAFNQHMTAARQRVEQLRNTLEQSYRSDSPLSLPEARVANAQAGRAARELRMADLELARMTPGFEQARRVAAREFGRAEALRELAQAKRRGRQD
ncbi:hypothetical protein [Paracoccus alkanivorans]|uniref:Flagellar export protein FliJ n=1 Tax=Paracoccus alkanivorans TaxID=2116655 RepID=A0A3M0MAE9_9RHOB|nr:hypothetical protein [Paracoccus alkanivorans]RMC33314.1 hypothetical protein C9E81_17445 [Paracoccus alkanivorans]